VFYNLTKGASKEQRKRFSLAQPDEYEYLYTCTDVDTIDDVDDFKTIQQAFKDLGFPPELVDNLYGVVSAVMALGNVTFTSGGRGGRAAVDDKEWLATAASLLAVDKATLEKALTIRELRIRNQETTLVDMNEAQALNTRDALAKFLYARMFDHLVQLINKYIGTIAQRMKTIGILDIFGFEIFEHNSFEQLCINFTNEMLQQHFNNQTFKLEEAVYKAEAIVFKHVEFIDNQPMLDLITKRPTGLLPLLDEELVMPKGSDKTFLGKIFEQHKKNRVFKSVLKNPNHFVVRHYAGDVIYDAIGFLEKNRDTLNPDLMEMLFTSTAPLINELFNEKVALSTADQKSSLSKQFQRQLNNLMQELSRTEPHYIRCVKPNENKAAMEFVPRNCMEQLTYSGVFEAVAIRKQGFPFRLKHDEFAARYKCCADDASLAAAGNGVQGLCSVVVKAMKLNKENVQTGR
jgi:myosin heavy subunit